MIFVRSSSLILATLIVGHSAPAAAQFGGLFGGPKVETIDTASLAKMVGQQRKAEQQAAEVGGEAPNADFVLVDVRSEAEVKVSVIPGAITKEDFQRNRSKYSKRLVIPYCTVGARSSAFAKQIAKSGDKVKNYEGSILAWVKAGLPLETLDGRRTNRVHTYSDRYQIPADYEQVTR